MRTAAAGAGAAAGLALAWASLCGVTYRRAFGPRGWGPDAGRGWTPVDIGADYERLPVRTGDGVDLLAWHLRGRLDAGVVVCGGYRGRAGDVLGIGGSLWRAGFHVAVFGWRGTPGSGAGAHTLGAEERLDLRATLDALVDRVGTMPVGLLGYSMGGAMSILQAAEDPRVRAVCTDSAFASAVEVLEDGVRRVLHLPGGVVSWPVAMALRLRTGARIDEVRPVDVVGRIAPRPLLVIHGAGDVSVPAAHAHRLFDAAGEPKQLWVAEGAPHVGAYFADRPGYTERVTAFFRDALTAMPAGGRAGCASAR